MSADKRTSKWQIGKSIAKTLLSGLSRKNIQFLVLCVLAPLASVAAELPNHYIIAFDLAVGNYRMYYSSATTLECLDGILKENGFNGDRDYVSVIGYTMLCDRPTMDEYVRPYKRGNDPVIWHRLGKKTLAGLFNDWPYGQPVLNSSFYGSLQSLAKPYSVIETSLPAKSRKYANRTFMYMVTDEVVNGTDDNYRQEWNRLSGLADANRAMFNAIYDSVSATLQAFNEEFKFLQIKLKKDGAMLDRIPISGDGKYKVVPYEVVSVERPSIHAITDIPSPLPLQRVRGGFMLKIDSRALSKRYSITKIDILSSEGAVLGSSATGKLDVFLPSEKVKVGDTMRLSLTVILNDGLYNGVIISPVNARYRDGMIVSQTVRIQNDAKIFGVLPLSDAFWWWYPNDIYSAVMIWDLIIILVFIFVIGFILYRCFVRINTYIPSNDRIIIKKIE